MRFSKIQVMTAMKETGMVPVFYNSDIEVSKKVVKACYEGGVRAFEFTNRGDFAHEVFRDLVKYAAKECPEMIMGIGSIVDAPTATLYIQMGANFIRSPIFFPTGFESGTAGPSDTSTGISGLFSPAEIGTPGFSARLF